MTRYTHTLLRQSAIMAAALLLPSGALMAQDAPQIGWTMADERGGIWIGARDSKTHDYMRFCRAGGTVTCTPWVDLSTGWSSRGQSGPFLQNIFPNQVPDMQGGN